MKRYLAYAGAVTALAGSAHGAYAADSTDDSLTWYGITLCGTVAKPTTQGDSSRAGQAFQGAAYGGVSSPVYGTLTVGRQNGLLFDNALKYEPLGGPYAFSLIGYSGAAGGSGDTQDARLGDSVKYVNQVGMFRIGAQFQNKYIAAAKCPGGTKDSGGCSGRLDAYSLAADHKFDRHFDVYTDFMWSRVADALAAGYLNSWTIDPTIGGRFNF